MRATVVVTAINSLFASQPCARAYVLLNWPIFLWSFACECVNVIGGIRDKKMLEGHFLLIGSITTPWVYS